MGKPKGGKGRKTELVFDEQKRKEFLTGFRKRKQERRKKAKEELEQQVKEERKRIKQELRDGFQDQFKKSFAPIELEGELKEEEYDTENVTVQIVELSTDEIAESNNWIGRNRPVYEINPNDKSQNADEEEEDESEEEEEEEEEVPGFAVTSTKPKRHPKTVAAADGEDAEAKGADSGEPKKRRRVTKLPDEVKSKRAMGQFIAKQGHNILKHTKAFRMKDRLERTRMQKKTRIQKDQKLKQQKKREGKHKKNSMKGKSKKEPKVNKTSGRGGKGGGKKKRE